MATKQIRKEVLADGWAGHLAFLLLPALIATLVVAAWYYLARPYGLVVSKRDEDILTNFHIPGLVVFHAIIAGFLFDRVLKGYSRMSVALGRLDEFAFREALDEKIPMITHMLLINFSLMVLDNTMILGYESLWVGAKSVGEMAFALALFWQVATVLDDPTRAPGLRNRIPKIWLYRIKRGIPPGQPITRTHNPEPNPFTLAGWPEPPSSTFPR